LRELCREGVTDDACDDAELLLSEMVGNAVQHAGTTVGTELCVDGPRLRLTVTDSSTRPVRARPLDLMAEGGRGLQLVDQLSERWGVEADRDGKRVWFELSQS
jgi:anti-sigma regulatory factor (Ser/Thr protein kinase)